MDGFWLWLLTLAVLAVGGAYAYSLFLRPLRDLEDALGRVSRGERPLTFVLGGADVFGRLGSSIEAVANEQARLRKQAEEGSFNLQAILSSMEEGVMVVDTEHVIHLVNQSFCKLFGIVGSPLQKTVLRALRDASVEEIVRSTLQAGVLQTREISPVHQSREEIPRHFAVSAVPLLGQGGVISGVVVVLHDISRLRQLEEIRREFVANVSHELRTPLSIFSGYLENLIDNPARPRKELLATFEIMEKHSRRLNALLYDLLTLARLESKRELLEPESIRLAPFLRQIASDWKMKLEQKKITLALNIPQETASFTADSLRMEQILNNLIDNAIKYTPEGGSIRIDTLCNEDSVTIRVEDSGIGIPARDLPHIFERFYRVEKARSRDAGGTGLGLSIVKHIVSLHGGSVQAESSPGKGTAITFVIPREFPLDPDATNPESQPGSEAPAVAPAADIVS